MFIAVFLGPNLDRTRENAQFIGTFVQAVVQKKYTHRTYVYQSCNLICTKWKMMMRKEERERARERERD